MTKQKRCFPALKVLALAVAVSSFVGCAAKLRAQVGTATLTGMVSDPILLTQQEEES
jgi:type IV pilus biogenesis protein CpaD/CtpE